MEYSLVMDSESLAFFDATVKLELSLWRLSETAAFHASGLKLGSLMALRAVAEQGDAATVQQLAAALGVTVGAASKLIDRLEDSEHVRRTPNVADGRSHVIARTTKGVRAFDSGMQAMTEALDSVLSGALNKQALHQLTQQLMRLAE